jgi:hypothetical protein
MKKLMLLSIVLLFVICSQSTYCVPRYETFEDYSVSGGKLLSDFTREDFKKYYGELGGSKFSGWRTYQVTKNGTMNYISQTLLVFYNDGTTPMNYVSDVNSETINKFTISATGSIGTKTTTGKKETKEEFKNALDKDLKLDASYSLQVKETKVEKISIVVDPKTQVIIQIEGVGHFTNGVARYYFAWIKFNEGGYEVFTRSSEAFAYIKKKI